jgi:hypothetical protein
MRQNQFHICWAQENFLQGLIGQEREADHSPPPDAKIKDGGAISPIPHTSSWQRLINQTQGRLYLS